MKTDTVLEDAKKYELMVILNPEIGQDQLNKELGEIKDMLAAAKDQAPQIFFEEIWGVRDLAYKIKKHERGFYAIYDFMMEPGLIAELDQDLRLEPNVLRHLIVTLPFAYEPKSYLVTEEEVAKVEIADEKKTERKPAPRKVEEVVVEKPVKKVEKEEVAEAEEEKPKKAAAKVKAKETTLEDVDAKLKSIIDNPDINF